MFLNFKNRFENRYFTIPFFGEIELSPFFLKYHATNFRTHEPIKIKVEAFRFDLRLVSSFSTMRYVFFKSKPYMKFSNAPMTCMHHIMHNNK